MADGAQIAEAGPGFLQILRDIGFCWWRAGEPPLDPAQAAQPMAGAHQRHLDMPTAALGGAAAECRQRADGQQLAGGVIERLHRHWLGRGLAGGRRLGVVDAGGRLHQAVKAALG